MEWKLIWKTCDREINPPETHHTTTISRQREREASRQVLLFHMQKPLIFTKWSILLLKKFQIIMVNYVEWYNYRGCELPESYFLGQLVSTFCILCLWHVVFIEVLPNVFFLFITSRCYSVVELYLQRYIIYWVSKY